MNSTILLDHGNAVSNALPKTTRVQNRGYKVTVKADCVYTPMKSLTFYDFHNLYSLVTDICPAEPYLSVMEQYGMKLLYQKDSND